MKFPNAKYVMMNGLRVRRDAWPQEKTVAMGREADPAGVLHVVMRSQGENYEPTTEDLGADDWSVVIPPSKVIP